MKIVIERNENNMWTTQVGSNTIVAKSLAKLTKSLAAYVKSQPNLEK